MRIPCDTIVRLSHLFRNATVPEFQTLRLEQGRVIASDRKLMAMEHVPSVQGVHHITVPDDLLEQCRVEAQFAGSLELVAMPGMIVGKTTMGFQTGNLAYTGSTTDFDRWPEVIADARGTPVQRGTMVWSAQDIERLARCSPSGVVEFPSVIDAQALSIVIRDSTSYEWCGFFHPKITDGIHYSGAVVPGWV